MEINWSEWANVIVRWVHVFAGILWVGTTYYFTWLDGRFTEMENAEPAGLKPGATGAEKKQSGAAPQVWMVHSGGFYVVEKQKTPVLLSGKLHWFRYEALLTFLSGCLLLGIVYYMGGALVDPDVARITPLQGMAIGIGAIFVGWEVYDRLWMSPLVKNETVGAAISYALIVAAAYGLTRVFSGRGAYIHVGAMLGTFMFLNVWMRILPAQKKMVAALAADRAPDLTLGARAKQRSKHNTFMVVPVVFTMISNHFPTATYGDKYAWVILAVLVLAGWGAAAAIRRA
jgi:uncharacterized membrane protein